MSTANPRWGSPRIAGKFAKLAIRVAKSTVEKYIVQIHLRRNNHIFTPWVSST
jgi:hypothetical protein